MIIYKITNLINNKVYIGQTINSLEDRLYVHFKRNLKSAISNAINKYGKENFKSEIIFETDDIIELNEKEKYYIEKYKSYNNKLGYNRTLGGQQNVLGYKHLEETKKKISESLRGKISPRKGVKLSAETRLKISISQIGRVTSEETKEKLRQNGYKRKNTYSEETRKKLSKAIKSKKKLNVLTVIIKESNLLYTGIILKNVNINFNKSNILCIFAK